MYGAAHAQGGAAGTTPPYMSPGLPSGTYPLSGFEDVNLFNGNLNFHLPLMQIGGRGGAHVPMMLKIEARWRVEMENCAPPCGPIFIPSYNWWTAFTVGYGPGIMEARPITFGTKFCTFGEEIPDKSLIRLTFTSSDGTEYELRDKLTDGAPQPIPNALNCPDYPWFNRGTLFVTADGTSATFYSCEPDGTPIPLHDSDGVIPSGILLLRDGSRYRIDGRLVTWMQDRNGNRLYFYYEHHDPQGNPDGRVTRIVDSLNRQITISYDIPAGPPYGNCDVITFDGFNGDDRIIRVSKDLMSNVLRPGFTIKTYHDLFPNLSGSSSTQFDGLVTSAVWLPNGQSYKFYYDDYGELSRIGLPTGAAVEYDWAAGMIGAPTGGLNGLGGIYRRIIERRVYPNGAGGSSFDRKETYSIPETYVNGGAPPNVGYVEVKQYDSNLSLRNDSKHYFIGSAVYNPNEGNNGVGFYYPWNSGKENKTELLDTDDSTILQSVENDFNQTSPVWWSPPFSCGTCIAPTNNPVLTETRTKWVQENQVAKQSYLYDQYNNKTVIQEFDYGTISPPTQPLRRTEIDYVTTGETNGIDYTGSNIGSNVNQIPYLRSLPKEQRIYAVSTIGTTTLAAKTHFKYDESALTDRPNITGWQSPVTAARGNLTTTSRWLDFPAPETWISATNKYDIAGRIVETTDAKGNTAKIEFANSSNTYAFPTTFKTPVPDPTGQRGSNAELQTLVGYDFSTGLVTSITNPNQKITTASYNDLLDRLTNITRPPGGGQTTYFYSDTVGNLFLRTQTTQDAAQTIENYQYFDGLGRTVLSSQSENSGSIFVETQYDALGRVLQVSNPYRTGDIKKWTITGYDELSRVVTVTQPGGAVTSNSYSGNTVTTTDPATKSRKAVSDALGRLTSVIEDPGTSPHLNYQTTYVYDTLDSLRKVSQGTQTRYFGYDSLNRLIRVKNPEQNTNANLPAFTDSVTSNTQWASSFSYEPNGNLMSKTDPRGVTTNLTYDALNRVKTRTYPNDPNQTPTVEYKYDGVGTTAQNALGKLTSVATSGSFVSSYTYDNFDAMGRVVHSIQTTDGNAYPMSYGYDFAGNLISETYPSGRVVTTGFDVAGRISDVSSGTLHYASSFSYTAHGGVTDMKLGNNLWEHTTFEPNRLQPTEIGLGTTQGASDKLKLNYGYGPLNTNNGNVLSQTITAPGLTFYQCYSYDVLNRLSTTEERSATNCTGTLFWKQAFIYDRFGNKNFDVANTTANVLGPNPTINQTSNRFDTGQNYFYDVAGNLIGDPTTPANGINYDAENRQTQYTKMGQGSNNYYYDGDGRRVKKIDNSGTTIFVYNVVGQLIAEYHSDPVPPPAGGGRTSYLTSDYLGSTRVVTKSDGSLKARYDYSPFGEELGSGIGGRTVGMGYSAADSTRQKFTQKERDNESALDYFGARYYSSAQGRFTSADPLLSSGVVVGPQSWNRYSYAFGNPLRYIDPTGLWVWSASLGGSATDEALRQQAGDDKNRRKEADKIIQRRQAFRDAKKAAEAARDNLAAGAERELVTQSLAAYGTERQDNGVTVGIGQLDRGDAAQASPTFSYGSDTYRVSVEVTIDNNTKGLSLTLAVAHEGRHVADAQAFAAAENANFGFAIAGSLNLTKYDREFRAYTVSSLIAQGLGREGVAFGGHEVWYRGWREADRATLRSKGINDYLKGKPYEVSPKSPGDRYIPFVWSLPKTH